MCFFYENLLRNSHPEKRIHTRTHKNAHARAHLLCVYERVRMRVCVRARTNERSLILPATFHIENDFEAPVSSESLSFVYIRGA